VRDVVAAIVAVLLLVAAASLATTLRLYRRQRQRQRDSERALGRTIVAELPIGDDLVLFSEDEKRFYLGEQSIDKDLITAVRVLINGAPIAAHVSRRADPRTTSAHAAAAHELVEDRPEGIARDRWDVDIETVRDVVIVPCGAIRERVSQELARTIYDAVKASVERLDGAEG